MFVPLRSQQSKKYLTIMETIQNELLTVEVSAMGAELQSICSPSYAVSIMIPIA